MPVLELMFERRTINKLNKRTALDNLKTLASILTQNPKLGFKTRLSGLADPTLIVGEEDKRYRYETKITVRVPDGLEENYKNIRENFLKKASSLDWVLIDENFPGLVFDNEIEPVKQKVERKLYVPELTNDVIKHEFAGVYERDPHIRIIHSAYKTCIESDGKVLSHILLYGQPGACKTKLTEKFKGWLDKSNNGGRVLFVDGTTMTKAGLENWLLELEDSDMLPEILVVDELEKQPMDNLLCLNGIMGSGVLAKLNARRGNERVAARFLVIGICNDVKALQEFRNGAMWSRFTHKLFCNRPSEELSLKILKEVALQIPGGRVEWAEKAMEFGWKELHQRDIREIKGHLDGRNRLLTGEWQNDKRFIIESEQMESTTMKKEEMLNGNTK